MLWTIERDGETVQEVVLELREGSSVQLKARTNVSVMTVRDIQFTTEKAAHEIANSWCNAQVVKVA
jgi:hypothetical protein